MKILITGASGLIGKNLVVALLREGHDVRALVRRPVNVRELSASKVFPWNGRCNPPEEALRDTDAVVHLAGENVAEGRWTKSRKEALRASRIESTRHLVEAISRLPPGQRPSAFLGASAVGYYGNSGDEVIQESREAGQGFLAGLCREWEGESRKASLLGLRVVLLRTGIVLSRNGGALAKMGPAVLGSGKQWMSWIHEDDVTGFLRFALENPRIEGPFNLTSPNPLRNRDFTAALAKARGIPFTVPAPAPILRLVLGELAQEALLSGQRALPERALSAGFLFRFPTVEQAFGQLFPEKGLLDQRFATTQFVPVPRAEVFPFFSRAENLETLTPPWLNFRILRQSTPQIEANTLIDYSLRIHGFPVRWRTRISEWNPLHSFVDDQLRGPYRRWHHVHRFEDVPGGTLLHDEVTFRVPGGLPGKLLLSAWIRRDVQQIFSFRQKRISELFPERPAT